MFRQRSWITVIFIYLFWYFVGRGFCTRNIRLDVHLLTMTEEPRSLVPPLSQNAVLTQEDTQYPAFSMNPETCVSLQHCFEILKPVFLLTQRVVHRCHAPFLYFPPQQISKSSNVKL